MHSLHSLLVCVRDCSPGHQVLSTNRQAHPQLGAPSSTFGQAA